MFWKVRERSPRKHLCSHRKKNSLGLVLYVISAQRRMPFTLLSANPSASYVKSSSSRSHLVAIHFSPSITGSASCRLLTSSIPPETLQNTNARPRFGHILIPAASPHPSRIDTGTALGKCVAPPLCTSVRYIMNVAVRRKQPCLLS